MLIRASGIYRARLALLCLLALAPAARADPLDLRAKYEESLVRSALLRNGLERDPRPEGKRIERIVVDASEVFLPGELPLADKLPWTFLNHFHARTRDSILLQELLFAAGDRYHADLIEESARNLRQFFILSVALLVAARGATPDSVVVLVVAKDKWSLRLNSEFELDQARLDYLSLSISESNLFGRNKRAELDLSFDPGRYTMGLGYLDPRIWGSRHQLTLTSALYLARDTGKTEGGMLGLTVGRPLYSLRTRFGWAANFLYVDDKVRYFRGADLALFTVGNESVPEVYARRHIQGSLEATYSTGVRHKLNLTAGFLVDSALYGLPDDFPTSLSATARNAFLSILPRSENSSGPYIDIHAFSAVYVSLRDIETYALSEDFQLGPSLELKARYADPAFGFNSRFLTVSGAYGDTRLFHDDLIQLTASLSARVQSGQSGFHDNSDLVSEDALISLRNVSPRFGPFRFHLSGLLEFRNRDLDHLILTLGSDNGLRGYAPRAFQGNNRYLINAELRTLGLNLWTLHVGAVVFYDAGDAPATLQTLSWHQDAGFGLRILIPQLNHEVLRLDLAFPFDAQPGTYVPRFSASFDQAF